MRDSSAGIGTLTFVDNTTGTFAGLGHSIHDVDTGTTISLLKGEIVPVEITGAVAGSAGSPGELKGRFRTSVPTGTITVNGETGVYGSVKSYMKGIRAEAVLAQEVKTEMRRSLRPLKARSRSVIPPSLKKSLFFV